MAVRDNFLNRFGRVGPYLPFVFNVGGSFISERISSFAISTSMIFAGYEMTRNGVSQVRQGGYWNSFTGAAQSLCGANLAIQSSWNAVLDLQESLKDIWKFVFPPKLEEFRKEAECESSLVKEAFYDHGYCMPSLAREGLLAKMAFTERCTLDGGDEQELIHCLQPSGGTNATRNALEIRPHFAKRMERCWEGTPWAGKFRYP